MGGKEKSGSSEARRRPCVKRHQPPRPPLQPLPHQKPEDMHKDRPKETEEVEELTTAAG